MQTTTLFAGDDGWLPNGTTGYSLVGAGVLFSVDTAGYQSISIHVISIGTGNTITFEESNDNTNWVAFNGYVGTNTGSAAPGSTLVVTGVWRAPTISRYVRARTSVAGSGTVTVIPVLRATPLPVLGVSANVPNSVGVQPSVASGVGGIALCNRLLSAAATTNSTLIKTGATRIYRIFGVNASAAVKFLKLYNKATAPTVGTDTPFATLQLAIGPYDIYLSDIGSSFSLGAGFGITGAAADADTTALVAGDIVCQNIFYA